MRKRDFKKIKKSTNGKYFCISKDCRSNIPNGKYVNEKDFIETMIVYCKECYKELKR